MKKFDCVAILATNHFNISPAVYGTLLIAKGQYMYNKPPKPPKGMDELRIIDVTSILDFIGGNGHSIFKYKSVLELTCAPAWLLDLHTEEVESDTSHHKSTIYNSRMEPIESVVGIYGLDLIEEIAGWFGVVSMCSGRGFRCSDLSNGIRTATEGVDPMMTVTLLQKGLEHASL